MRPVIHGKIKSEEEKIFREAEYKRESKKDKIRLKILKIE